jgi:uncharacterized membrane protein
MLTFKKKSFLKKLGLFTLSAFYIGAGSNHFWHPKAYIDLIPPYFANHYLLNIISGISEILAGILILFPGTRKMGTFLIIALLIAFIPAHIYLIQMKGCISKYMCTSEWIAWLRLIPIQFILMWWAWKTYKSNYTE